MVSIEHTNAVDEFVSAKFGSDYKQLQGGERLYNCQWHEDRVKSLSVNIDKCVYNCHSCDAKGSFYKLAKEKGWENPHRLIPNNGNSAIVQNGYISTTSKTKKKKPTITYTRKELAIIQKENVNRLKNNMDKYWDGYLWDDNLIDLLDIGVCTRGIWQIAQHNRDADIIAIKTHKPFGIIGLTKAKWYAQHLIHDYDHSKDWVLSEGEKDFWTLFSRNQQVFTGTCGAKNIPKDIDGNYDLSPFRYFTNDANGYVAYDNDDTGKKYGLIIGTEILKENPSHNIYQSQWGDNCADKFDITDSYDESPKDGIKYMEAIMNAKRIKLPKVTYGSFEILRGSDADRKPIKHSIEIVQHLLVQDMLNLFGGTAGCNKSLFNMQMGMGIANDEDKVLGKEINVKGLKVLYVDTECGIEEMNRRYNLLKKNFKNWQGSDRFIMMSRKAKIVTEILDDIEKAIQQEKPDVVIIDCLYNIGQGKVLSKSEHLSPITDRVIDWKLEYGTTPQLIAHSTKGNHEQGLKMDRIAGASHLQNCAEHIVLFTRTNKSNMRMLRIDKSRATGFPNCYYGYYWDGDRFFMDFGGMIEKPKEYMITEEKMTMYSEWLKVMKDPFTTRDWCNEVEVMGGKKLRTAMGYLADMCQIGLVLQTHKGSGIYTKNMEIIGDDSGEE